MIVLPDDPYGRTKMMQGTEDNINTLRSKFDGFSVTMINGLAQPPGLGWPNRRKEYAFFHKLSRTLVVGDPLLYSGKCDPGPENKRYENLGPNKITFFKKKSDRPMWNSGDDSQAKLCRSLRGIINGNIPDRFISIRSPPGAILDVDADVKNMLLQAVETGTGPCNTR